MPAALIRCRMSPRHPDEQHRVASPLELLFDLTFVIAVAAAAAELAHSLADGHYSIAGLLQVFFTVWWAWMNFTLVRHGLRRRRRGLPACSSSAG